LFGLGWAKGGKNSVGRAKGGNKIVWDGLRVETNSVGWAKGGKIVWDGLRVEKK